MTSDAVTSALGMTLPQSNREDIKLGKRQWEYKEATEQHPRKRKKLSPRPRCPDCDTRLVQIEDKFELRDISPRIYKFGYTCDMCNMFNSTWPMWHCPGRNKSSSDLCFWDCCQDCLHGMIQEERNKKEGLQILNRHVYNVGEDIMAESHRERKPSQEQKDIEKKIKERVLRKYRNTKFQNQKWFGFFEHKGTKFPCGAYSQEIFAAWAVNLKCDELKIQRKNLNVQKEPPGFRDQVSEPSSPLLRTKNANLEKRQHPSFHPLHPGTLISSKKLKASRKKSPLDEQFTSSKYRGVMWSKQLGRWVAYVETEIRGLSFFAGRFDKERDAAQAVNAKCDELLIPWQNLDVGIPTAIVKIAVKQQSTYKNFHFTFRNLTQCMYSGVYWDAERHEWSARFEHNKRDVLVGYFEDERRAALAVNNKCLDLGISIKNPHVKANHRPLSNQRRMTKQKALTSVLPTSQHSKFEGVSWNHLAKKWLAQVVFERECYFGGNYNVEVNAAHAVNAWCKILGIPEMNTAAAKVGRQKDSEEQMSTNLQSFKNSSFEGVFQHNGRWCAVLYYNGVGADGKVLIGDYSTELAAAQSINAKCVEHGLPLQCPDVVPTLQTDGLNTTKPQKAGNVRLKFNQSSPFDPRNQKYLDEDEEGSKDVAKSSDAYEPKALTSNQAELPSAPLKQLTIAHSDDEVCETSQSERAPVLIPQSTYIGVSWNVEKGKWQSQVYDSAGISIGYFENDADAAKAHDKMFLSILGSEVLPSQLNFPTPPKDVQKSTEPIGITITKIPKASKRKPLHSAKKPKRKVLNSKEARVQLRSIVARMQPLENETRRQYTERCIEAFENDPICDTRHYNRYVERNWFRDICGEAFTKSKFPDLENSESESDPVTSTTEVEEDSSLKSETCLEAKVETSITPRSITGLSLLQKTNGLPVGDSDSEMSSDDDS